MANKQPINERPSTSARPDAPVGKRCSAGRSTPRGGWRRAIRENIEWFVMMLAVFFLFRTFEAEAFIIPTGSMAPTLQGRHKDLVCPQCGLEYRIGASGEVDDYVQSWQARLNEPGVDPAEQRRLVGRIQGSEVVQGTCPNCRFTMDVDPRTAEGGKWAPGNGDRIMVAKFPYELADPKRWDVVVFRYPGNGQMNYIKRLVGLPRETVRIEQGDVYVRRANQPFEIVQKPAAKVWSMAQLVYNNDYVVDTMTAAGWPLRWQPMGSTDIDGRRPQLRNTRRGRRELDSLSAFRPQRSRLA
jgi:signal peptidase I